MVRRSFSLTFPIKTIHVKRCFRDVIFKISQYWMQKMAQLSRDKIYWRVNISYSLLHLKLKKKLKQKKGDNQDVYHKAHILVRFCSEVNSENVVWYRKGYPKHFPDLFLGSQKSCLCVKSWENDFFNYLFLLAPIYTFTCNNEYHIQLSSSANNIEICHL